MSAGRHLIAPTQGGFFLRHHLQIKFPFFCTFLLFLWSKLVFKVRKYFIEVFGKSRPVAYDVSGWWGANSRSAALPLRALQCNTMNPLHFQRLTCTETSFCLVRCTSVPCIGGWLVGSAKYGESFVRRWRELVRYAQLIYMAEISLIPAQKPF